MKTRTRTNNDQGSGERLRTLSDAELSAVAGGTIQPTDPPDGYTTILPGEGYTIQPADPPPGG